MKSANQPQASPDAVCARQATRRSKITCRIIDGNAVLLEGTSEALTFLGQLLIAQAGFKEDCGFQLEPKGAGAKLFPAQSDHGIYIHRLPCKHPRDQK